MFKFGILRVLAASSVLAMTITTAQSQNPDMQWTTGGYDDRGSYTAYLAHGVPETDDVQFNATCSSRKDKGIAPAVLSYNTGNLRENARVNVQFLANGQQIYQKPGRVFGTQAEHGVSGVRFRPSFHDYFWQVLSRGGTLSYRIQGRQIATINLNGAAGPIRQFTETCKSPGGVPKKVTGGGGGASTDGPVPPRRPRLDRRSCDQLGRLKSVNSNIPLTLTFTNRSGSHRAILWLDYQGRPIDYAALNAGQSHTQQTFVGHPWMFTDGPGNCKGIYVPRQGDTKIDITK